MAFRDRCSEPGPTRFFYRFRTKFLRDRDGFPSGIAYPAQTRWVSYPTLMPAACAGCVTRRGSPLRARFCELPNAA